MQTAIAENSRMALEQNEYERRYADLTERYNTIKADYDKISEQIESKKAQRELFKGFIRALEKQGALVEEFDEGLWSSLVQEVVVLNWLTSGTSCLRLLIARVTASEFIIWGPIGIIK